MRDKIILTALKLFKKKQKRNTLLLHSGEYFPCIGVNVPRLNFKKPILHNFPLA